MALACPEGSVCFDRMAKGCQKDYRPLNLRPDKGVILVMEALRKRPAGPLRARFDSARFRPPQPAKAAKREFGSLPVSCQIAFLSYRGCRRNGVLEYRLSRRLEKTVDGQDRDGWHRE